MTAYRWSLSRLKMQVSVGCVGHEYQNQNLHQEENRGADERYCNLPEISSQVSNNSRRKGSKDIPFIVVDRPKMLEVHSEITLKLSELFF